MNNDTVVIELDKPRTLKFRRKELKMLEKVFNKKIPKIDFEGMDIDDMTKMVHVGLVHDDPDLTLAKTEQLLDDADLTFGEMLKATMDAFSISMGGKRIELHESNQEADEKN